MRQGSYRPLMRFREINRDGNQPGGVMPEVPDLKSGFLTSEFWTTIAGSAANLTALLTMVGWLNSGDAQTLGHAVTESVVAVQTLLVNGMLIWNYISKRFQLKKSLEVETSRRLGMLLDNEMRMHLELAKLQQASPGEKTVRQ